MNALVGGEFPALLSEKKKALLSREGLNILNFRNTRWFKYDRDCLCVNKSQFVPVIFEPPCISAPVENLNMIFPKPIKISQIS